MFITYWDVNDNFQGENLGKKDGNKFIPVEVYTVCQCKITEALNHFYFPFQDARANEQCIV